MPKPITTLEDVLNHAQGVMKTLQYGVLNKPEPAIIVLAECLHVLATIAAKQQDEIAVLRKVLAQDKPAVMRNRETK